MGDLKGWFDVVFKTIIAAGVAYGGWYVSQMKQTTDTTHTVNQQENDDIRLIADLVSSSEPARRNIGVSIMAAYAEADPPRVPRKFADAINAFILVNTPLSTAAADRDVVRVQGPDPASAAKGSTTGATALPLRVYIQFQRPADRDAVEAIRQKTNGAEVDNASVLVPPIENVRVPVPAPTLRCFRKADCDTFGSLLLAQLKANGAPAATTLQLIPNYENSTTIRPNHFEAWFGPLS